MTEVRGVRLGDVYRGQDGALWEVVALCTEPQATVRRVGTAHEIDNPRLAPQIEHHVIGCRNWQEKWAAGPLRPVERDARRHIATEPGFKGAFS